MCLLASNMSGPHECECRDGRDIIHLVPVAPLPRMVAELEKNLVIFVE